MMFTHLKHHFQIIRRIIMNMFMMHPRCNRFEVADASLYEQYLAFLDRWDRTREQDKREALQPEAEILADKLHTEALGLAYSKTYELSHDIYWLNQCAAVITLLAFGRKSEIYLKYEKSLLGNTKPYFYTQQQRNFVRYRNKFTE